MNREQITAAVLKIAETEGFEAVTMKRIAEELDGGTMTLYYSVRTKADILGLMHDAILSESFFLNCQRIGERRCARLPGGRMMSCWRTRGQFSR